MKKLTRQFIQTFVSLIVLVEVSNTPLSLVLDKANLSVSFERDIILTSLVAKTPFEEGRRMNVELTAYSSTSDQTDATPFITAAGTNVRDGIVAANFLPFHSRIKIPELFGEKVFVVEDRMARRFQNRVDVWFPTRAAALTFGIKKAEIVVLN